MTTYAPIGETESVQRLSVCSPFECDDCSAEFASPPPRRCHKCGGRINENPALRVAAGGVEQTAVWARVLIAMDDLSTMLTAYNERRNCRASVAAARADYYRAGGGKYRGTFGYTILMPNGDRETFSTSAAMIDYMQPIFHRNGSRATGQSIARIINRAVRAGRDIYGMKVESSEAMIGRSRPVLCKTTGQQFRSINSAAMWVVDREAAEGRRTTTASVTVRISRACKTGRPAVGLEWAFNAEEF